MFMGNFFKSLLGGLSAFGGFFLAIFTPKNKKPNEAFLEIVVTIALFVVGGFVVWTFGTKVFTGVKDWVTGNTKEQLATKVVVQQNQIDRLQELLIENQRTLEAVKATSELALEAARRQVVVEKEIRTHTETIVYQHASTVAEIKNDPTLTVDQKREKISATNIDSVNASYNYYIGNASGVATGEKK